MSRFLLATAAALLNVAAAGVTFGIIYLAAKGAGWTPADFAIGLFSGLALAGAIDAFEHEWQQR